MSSSSMLVRIAFARSFAQAGSLASLLEAEGFHPLPLDTSAHISVAGAEQGYYLEVPRSEALAAAAFLRENGYGRCLIP